MDVEAPTKADLVRSVSRIEDRCAVIGTYVLDAKLHVRDGTYGIAAVLLEKARRELEVLDEAIGLCRQSLRTA